MPKIILNGKELEFQPGQTIIEIAFSNGIVIPHFCWHPSLSVSGNCRMCLVEVEKMPKLVIACSTLATDGMIVHVDSEKSIQARKAVMEFLLINHPLDCPICDEAGECKLQDYAYSHSIGESRFDEEKVHKEKRVELGPYVMFDAERCISCSRCIRFCDEVVGENQLTFVNRGDRVTITTYPGKTLDNNYSLNTTDICPVGALTNRDFRFKARVWDMSRTESICVGCSRGCNDEVWVRNNEILRLTPRYNEDVNSYWMCDYGRISTFKWVNSETRVNGTFVRKETELIKTELSAAVTDAANRLKKFKANEIAVIGSSFATCEDNFILTKFAKQTLNTKIMDFASHIVPGSGDNFLLMEDKSPNALGAELVGVKAADGEMNLSKILELISSGKIKALYCLDDDIAGLDPSYINILSKLELLIVHATNVNNTTDLADIIFPAATYAEKEGTMVNFLGRIQLLHPAVATTQMDRSSDGLALSRLDKFGTQFDAWSNGKKKDAYPAWQIILMIAAQLGAKYKYNYAEDVFDEIVKTIPVFSGLNYETIGTRGADLKIVKQEVI